MLEEFDLLIGTQYKIEERVGKRTKVYNQCYINTKMDFNYR